MTNARHNGSGSWDETMGSAAAVAALLVGSWRPEPPPLCLMPEALDAALPLLREGTAAPLVWRRLRAAGLHTARPVRPLQWRYREFAVEAAGHEYHLQEVVPFLRSVGVEPILIKGWSVARHYPETGLRSYGDLDLCVAHDQFDAALEALTRADRRDWKVELHEGIADLRDRTWAEALGRSRLVRLGAVDVRVLCPEDELRLIVMHQMRHGALAPLMLCDVAVALEGRPADFDWDDCLRGHPARAAWMLCFIGLARQLLDARLGDTALEARTNDLPPWLVPTVLARWERSIHERPTFDPLKSAYRLGLRPGRSLLLTQALGLVGRLAEVPARARRRARRQQRAPGLPFAIHDEPGA